MKIRQARKIMRNTAHACLPVHPAGSRPWRRPIYRGDTIAKSMGTVMHVIIRTIGEWANATDRFTFSQKNGRHVLVPKELKQ